MDFARKHLAKCFILLLIWTSSGLWGQNASDIFNNLSERQSAEALGAGRINTTNTGSLAALQYNPALLGQLDGVKTEIHGFRLADSFWIYQNIWTAPTIYGNVAAVYSFWDNADQFLRFSEVYDFFFAYSLKMPGNWHVGAGYIQDPLRKSFFAGAHVPFFSQIRIWKFIGFWDLSYAASVQNLNIENSFALPNLDPKFSQGFSFKVVSSDYVELKAMIEADFRYDFLRRNFRIGSEMVIYDHFLLMMGGWGTELMQLDVPTFGAGVQWQASHMNLRAVYSQEELNGFKNHAASFQFDFRLFGEYTRELSGEIINDIFSPRNSDGKRDVSIFLISQAKKIIPEKWKLFIIDDNGNPLRTYSSKDKRYAKKVKFIPEEVVWNGRDNYNNYVPDGLYTVRFQYYDKRNNPYFIRLPDVLVDNKPPAALINIDKPVIYIDKEGEYSPLQIDFRDYDNDAGDTWHVAIKDNAGVIVRSWSIKGDRFANEIVWDARDVFGKLVSTGIYTVSIYGEDRAENRSTPINFDIEVQYSEYSVSLCTNHPSFSPNGDRVQDKLFLDSIIERRTDIKSWQFLIKNQKNTTIYQKKQFQKAPPVLFEWTGKSRYQRRKLPDGSYFVELIIRYDNNFYGKSYLKEIEIDTKRPDSDFTFGPKLFSPDGDGVDELVGYDILAVDNSNIAKWKLEIISVATGRTFRTFQGLGDPPKRVQWDGTGDDGKLAESFSLFDAQVEVWDKAGNKRKRKKGRVEVDFLIFNLGDELRVQDFGILWASSRSGVYPAIARKLNKVGRVMKNRLKDFQLTVEGYSDLIGSPKIGQRISERRAKAVRNYLIKKYKFKPHRVIAVGMGMQNPVTTKKGPRNQRLNRRVELHFKRVVPKKKEGDDS